MTIVENDDIISTKELADALRIVGANILVTENGVKPICYEWMVHNSEAYKWTCLHSRRITDEENATIDFNNGNKAQIETGDLYNTLGEPKGDTIFGIDADNKPGVNLILDFYKVPNLEELAKMKSILVDINPDKADSSSHIYGIIKGKIEFIQLNPIGGKESKFPKIEIFYTNNQLITVRKLLGNPKRYFDNLEYISMPKSLKNI